MDVAILAEYIIKKCNNENILLDRYKLQYILYYTQSLCVSNKILAFDEPILASKERKLVYIESIENIYSKYKNCHLYDFYIIGNKDYKSIIDEQVLNYTDEIISLTKDYTSLELRKFITNQVPYVLAITGTTMIVKRRWLKSYYKSEVG